MLSILELFRALNFIFFWHRSHLWTRLPSNSQSSHLSLLVLGLQRCATMHSFVFSRLVTSAATTLMRNVLLHQSDYTSERAHRNKTFVLKDRKVGHALCKRPVLLIQTFMQKKKKRGGEELRGEWARNILQSGLCCLSHRSVERFHGRRILEPWNAGAKDMLSGCHRRDCRVLSQADWSGSQWVILERDGAWMLTVTAFNFKKFQDNSSRSRLAYNYWHSLRLLWTEMAFLVWSLQRLKLVLFFLAMINFQNANHKILKMFFWAQKLWSTSANLFLGQRTEQNDIKSVAKYFVLDSASVKLLCEISLQCFVYFHASLTTDT